MLRYGINNNFIAFREWITSEAMKTYGNIGTMFDESNYPVLAPVRVDDYELAAEHDPLGVNKTLYIEACKQLERQKRDMESDKPKLHGLIYQHLSEESKDAIRMDSTFASSNQQRDPLTLWKAIVSTHLVASTAKTADVLKAESRGCYHSVRKGD